MGTNAANGTAHFSHGTHVAGIAGGVTNNNIGVSSIGWSNQIMAIKATEDTQTGTAITNGYGGISIASLNGADVINCSWGSYGYSQTNYNIILNAYNSGVVIVAAAGNNGVNIPMFPAAYGEGFATTITETFNENLVVAVAALDQNSDRSQWASSGPFPGSNFGEWVDISAYGTGIYSLLANANGGTPINNTYGIQSGTSMATPMVSGLAGMLISYNSAASNNQIIDCILQTANTDIYDATLHPSNLFGQLGSGRIDAELAIHCLGVPCSSSPLALITASSPTICPSSSVTLSANQGVGYTWSTGSTTQTVTATSAGIYTVTVDFGGCSNTASFTLTNSPTQASVVISENSGLVNGDGILCGQDYVTLLANYGSSYLWNTGSTNQGYINANVGAPPATWNYSVTVTGVYGCAGITDVVSGSVTWQERPAVSITPISQICTGESVTLTANITGGTSPISYNWSTGEIINPIVVMPTVGTYTYWVTATSPNGCRSTDSEFFPVFALPIPNMTVTDVDCNGNSNGSITTFVNQAPPYSYLWSNTETTQNISGIPAGNYQLTLTDANCSSISTITVAEPTLLAISVNATNITCNGYSDGLLTANVTGGTFPYSYLWSNGQTNQTATGLIAGNYTLTVSDINLCKSITSGTINQPLAINVSTSVTAAICSGLLGQVTSAATGGVTPYSFVWSNGQTTSNISGLTAGNYGLTTTDFNGCVSSITSIVTATGNLTIDNLFVDNDNCNDCIGTIKILISGGTQPYSYVWDNSALSTTNDISGLCAGTYNVTIDDASGAGCSITTSATVNNLGVYPTANLINTIHDNCGSCTGSIEVSGSGSASPYTYTWNDPNNQVSNVATGLCVGTYIATVTEGFGCSTTVSESITLTNPIPVITITPLIQQNPAPPIICEGEGIVLSALDGGVSSYLWDNGSGLNKIVVSPNITTSYSVTVTYTNGCSGVGNITITVLPAPPTLSIVNTVNEDCNFCNGSAQVGSTGGTAPIAYSWNSMNSQTTLTATGLCSGSYILEAIDDNGCTSSIGVAIGSTPLGVTTTDGLLKLAGGTDYNPHFENTTGNVPDYWTAFQNPVSLDLDKDLDNIDNATDIPLSNVSDTDPANGDGCLSAKMLLGAPNESSYLVLKNTEMGSTINLTSNKVYMVRAQIKVDLTNVGNTSITEPLLVDVIVEPDMDYTNINNGLANHGTARSWKLTKAYSIDNPNELIQYKTIEKCFTSEAYYSTAYNQNFKNIGFQFRTASGESPNIKVQVDGVEIQEMSLFEQDPNTNTFFNIIDRPAGTVGTSGLGMNGMISILRFYKNTSFISQFSDPEKVYYFHQITNTTTEANWNHLAVFQSSQTITNFGGVIVLDPFTHLEITSGVFELGATGKICLGKNAEFMAKQGNFKYSGGSFDLSTGSACIGVFNGGNMEISANQNMDIIRGFVMFDPTGTVTMNTNSSMTYRYGGRIVFGGASSTNTGNIAFADGTVIIDKEGKLVVAKYIGAGFNGTSELIVKDGGIIELDGTNAVLGAGGSGKITLENGSQTFIRNGAQLASVSGGVITVKNGATITVENAGQLIAYTGGQINIENGAIVIVEDGGMTYVMDGGELVLKDATALQLQGSNSILQIDGTLTTNNGIDVNVNGNGFIRFMANNVLNLGAASDIIVSGNGNTDKVIELDSYTTVALTQGHHIDVRNGLINGLTNSRISATNNNVYFDNVAFTLAANAIGIETNSGLGFTYKNSTSTGGLTGISITASQQTPVIQNSSIDFAENGIVLDNMTTGCTVLSTTFDNCDRGIQATNINTISIIDCKILDGTTVGLDIDGAYNITSNQTIYSGYGSGTGVKLNAVSTFILTGSSSQVTLCQIGIDAFDSDVYIRNGAVVDENVTYGINIEGTTPADASLIIGDQGCGSVINNHNIGINAKNIDLQIDAEQHAINNGNAANIIPNKFHNTVNPSAYRIQLCYNPPIAGSTVIDVKGNYWGTIPPNTGMFNVKRWCVKQYQLAVDASNYSTNNTLGCESGKSEICELTNVPKDQIFTGGGTTTVGTSTTWTNTTYYVDGTVVVPKGVVLDVIGTEIVVAKNAAFVVEQGGLLRIDQSKMRTCVPGKVWQGIRVYGNSKKPQNFVKQGAVIVTGSQISDAEIAIYTGKQDNNGKFKKNTGGGIVQIDGSIFENNQVHIRLNEYDKYATISYASKTQFSQKQLNPMFVDKPRHIYAKKMVGLKLSDNTFVGGERGLKLKKMEQTYITNNTFTDITKALSVKKPEQFFYIGNTITNTTRGIKLSKGELVEMTGNTFTNFETAVKLNKPKELLITKNIFASGVYGIKLKKAKGITITENRFEDVKFPIESKEAKKGNNPDYLAGNKFITCETAVKLEAGNNVKLKLNCNEFTNYTQYAVKSVNTMLSKQGTDQIGAGNKFLPNSTAANNCFNHTGNTLNYYYSPSVATSFIATGLMTGNISRVQAVNEAGCPATVARLAQNGREAFDSAVEENTAQKEQERTDANIAETGEYINMVLYPNPNNGQFTIVIDGQMDEQYDLYILNIVGKHIGTARQITGNTATEIQLSEATGIYFVVIQNNDGVVVGKQRVIIQ